ncbi:hypothetical protein [Pseudomonas denitrificans (nom. rej.)]|uniref:Uncharacterized protein n=1 Tax=Pseudomonas denitrificans TaxID=43306 RepID=A0A9X7R591_PSEDE|nr:hypothetical protein [Pseudomonas denitrificans (nom. rej.)]QEY73253.1 hypothetical protein F1C79_17505 [Pseudomonas denitrificans (nom. rej.)]
MGKPLGDLARQALDRAKRIPPAPARQKALARPAQAERKAITERREEAEEGLPVRVAPAGQRIDQVLFRQGRIETAELLSTMLGMIEHRGAAAEVIARLRKGAEAKPASYAAGVEALLDEVAAMVSRHEMNNPQNVARESWR